MMLSIEQLGLSANQWQFLLSPERYVEASKTTDRPLLLESTRRQFVTACDILARLNGSQGEKQRRGILLADDVGLGKTTVAALVAWVVARAGVERRVRILTPNDVMKRRWADELRSHVPLLQECAETLDIQEKLVKDGWVGNLRPGRIQVVTHYHAVSGKPLDCELLIIDEAHRAKGDGTAFSATLKKKAKQASRVLILTATPFSIHLDELNRMLTLIGGEAAHASVRSLSRCLDRLYSENTAKDPEEAAKHLAIKVESAVKGLAPFVIRHGIDDLPHEQKSFGVSADWNINVPEAKPNELELLMRMDRALRVATSAGFAAPGATNDVRFHVGWRHLDSVRKSLKSKVQGIAEPARTVVEHELKAIRKLRAKVGIHSKMAAVAAEVKTTIEQGEKVVLFCDYIATAQELTLHLNSVLPKLAASKSLTETAWKQAWNKVLQPAGDERHEKFLRDTFIEWLCSIRTQTATWLPVAYSISRGKLAHALQTTPARPPGVPETIGEAAQSLYHALIQSKSSQAVLRAAADRPELLPGANGNRRVLAVCPPTEHEWEKSLFLQNQQPDTVISIFNSPFGPDALVVTDRLSEGIDLHRYCRHLVHYELDPSPIRTVQRNGRIRRVNSWAAATGKPIRYAYPAFFGTRDHRLVQIMKKRIGSFSLLLGGVQDFDVEQVEGSDEQWRNKVIKYAKGRLRTAGRQLGARQH